MDHNVDDHRLASVAALSVAEDEQSGSGVESYFLAVAQTHALLAVDGTLRDVAWTLHALHELLAQSLDGDRRFHVTTHEGRR